ncbi:hypothetical protein PR202_ga18168 [Eleusine coracana subsp. coracana]|uniref:Single-stranded DNA-binding protein WHY1, chloroplastic n=1 Tax=Eleusine coracana subsp. coracana TaxID=191504 RepID=A0AAV5CRS3_ELECO|nr:hypothetical protein PR202_ga18168 [Eleusine coracana subsp. coracana]
MPPPPLFLSLPSPAPPLLPVHLPKAGQTISLASPVPSSRKPALPACSVASPRHSDYFDPRAPPPPPRGDGYGRPPPNGSQEGRVFTSYSIYKGKAALSFDPRPPQFVPLDSGAYKVAKEGCVLLQFAPAVATRQYDWSRKQVFSLSVWEIGTLLTLGPTDSCEFFHDPFKGRSLVSWIMNALILTIILSHEKKNSEEGKVRKVLKVEPTPDGNGRFFNLSVQNRLLNIDESIYIPISKGEFAVIVSTLNLSCQDVIRSYTAWSVGRHLLGNISVLTYRAAENFSSDLHVLSARNSGCVSVLAGSYCLVPDVHERLHLLPCGML